VNQSAGILTVKPHGEVQKAGSPSVAAVAVRVDGSTQYDILTGKKEQGGQPGDAKSGQHVIVFRGPTPEFPAEKVVILHQPKPKPRAFTVHGTVVSAGGTLVLKPAPGTRAGTPVEFAIGPKSRVLIAEAKGPVPGNPGAVKSGENVLVVALPAQEKGQHPLLEKVEVYPKKANPKKKPVKKAEAPSKKPAASKTATKKAAVQPK